MCRKSGHAGRDLVPCTWGEEMEKVTDAITAYCVARGIIDPTDTPWFRYGLEKRILSTLCMALLSALAAFISDIPTAVSFLLGFQLLREKISGFHAKTPAGCLCMSVLTELLFFGWLYPRFCLAGMFLGNLLSTAVIFILAPYNHPDMHLSEDEIQALRSSGRILAISIMLIALVCGIAGLRSIACGLTIAVTMAAFLLCIAYFFDWRKSI